MQALCSQAIWWVDYFWWKNNSWNNEPFIPSMTWRGSHLIVDAWQASIMLETMKNGCFIENFKGVNEAITITWLYSCRRTSSYRSSTRSDHQSLLLQQWSRR